MVWLILVVLRWTLESVAGMRSDTCCWSIDMVIYLIATEPLQVVLRCRHCDWFEGKVEKRSQSMTEWAYSTWHLVETMRWWGCDDSVTTESRVFKRRETLEVLCCVEVVLIHLHTGIKSWSREANWRPDIYRMHYSPEEVFQTLWFANRAQGNAVVSGVDEVFSAIQLSGEVTEAIGDQVSLSTRQHCSLAEEVL